MWGSPGASAFFPGLVPPSFGTEHAVSHPSAASKAEPAGRDERRWGSEDLFDKRARRRSRDGADGTRRSVHAPRARLGGIAARSSAPRASAAPVAHVVVSEDTLRGEAKPRSQGACRARSAERWSRLDATVRAKRSG